MKVFIDMRFSLAPLFLSIFEKHSKGCTICGAEAMSCSFGPGAEEEIACITPDMCCPAGGIILELWRAC